MGILVDRIGARPVILVSVVIAGAGMFLMSVINSLLMFYIALMIISLGMSGGSHGVTWTSVIAKWFRRLRGRATGLAVTGTDDRRTARGARCAPGGGARVARRASRPGRGLLGHRSAHCSSGSLTPAGLWAAS